MFDKLGCATVLTLVIGFAPQNVVLTAKINRSGPYNPLELQRIRGVAPTDGWLLGQVSPALVPLLALGRPREPGPPIYDCISRRGFTTSIGRSHRSHSRTQPISLPWLRCLCSVALRIRNRGASGAVTAIA